MTDKEHDEQDAIDESANPAVKSKHDRAAADLEKVTDFREDNDNVMKEVSHEKLDSLISGPQAAKKTVNIRKEDVQLIMEELELPRVRAERKLMEHDGDVIAATKDLLGF